MIWVDYAIAGLLIFCLVQGIVRGGRLEGYALVVRLVAVVVAFGFAVDFAGFIPFVFKDPVNKLLASCAGLFILTHAIGLSIRLILGKAVFGAEKSWFQRFTGLIAGGLHGFLLATLCIVLAGLTKLPQDNWWAQSQLIPYFQTIAEECREFLPRELGNQIHYR